MTLVPVLCFSTRPGWSLRTSSHTYVSLSVRPITLSPQLTPASAAYVLSSRFLLVWAPSQSALLLCTWWGLQAGLKPGSTSYYLHNSKQVLNLSELVLLSVNRRVMLSPSCRYSLGIKSDNLSEAQNTMLGLMFIKYQNQKRKED